MNFTVLSYGNPEADTLLIQMVDDHDMGLVEREVSLIRELSGGQDFCLKAVRVNSWNQDLSPWTAPAVFGNEDFGDGAAKTLAFILDNIIFQKNDQAAGMSPDMGMDLSMNMSKDMTAAGDLDPRRRSPAEPRRIFLGGYSLAGLFALWAGYQTAVFNGIAAASPSIWFPHFTEYMKENEILAESVYLSLGDREERTRHPVMSQVGNAIRTGYDLLMESGRDCILEWNKGNHFKDPERRTAKAFAWLMLR